MKGSSISLGGSFAPFAFSQRRCVIHRESSFTGKGAFSIYTFREICYDKNVELVKNSSDSIGKRVIFCQKNREFPFRQMNTCH